MRKMSVIMLSLLLVFSIPLFAAGMSHEKGEKGMDHSMHEKMDHSGHDMQKGMDHGQMHDMQMLGQCDRDGIRAMGHIKAYGADAVASMSKMGMEGTHHFMVYFENMQNGEEITEGMAAVKVTGPDGKESDAVKLMSMGKGFGADIALKQKGEYEIEVGTKLKDGEKRQFQFVYDVK